MVTLELYIHRYIVRLKLGKYYIHFRPEEGGSAVYLTALSVSED